MADFEYVAKLNIEDILKGVTKVDKATEDMAKNLDASFKKAGKSLNGLFIDSQGRVREANGRFSKMGEAIRKAGEEGEKAGQKTGQSFQISGVKIGLVSGITQELTRRFISLGQSAVNALSDMTKEAVNLAAEFETTEAIFTGVFQGNEAAAVGALSHIREQSRALGIDLQGVSRAFLPFVASLKELDRVNRAAAALAISQPEQGEVGARIALQEALSGNMTSLIRRFEIPKNLGKELQAAFDEGGVEAFLTTFEGIMQRMGRDIDALTDTFQFSFSRTQVNLQQLQTSFGIPITDDLKEQFDELNDTFEKNFDDLSVIADTFGRVFANVVDIVGGGINDALKNLDTEQATRIAEIFFDITESARLLVSTLSGADISSSLLDNVEALAKKLDEALVTSVQLNALSEAGAAKAKAEYEEWVKELERLHGQGTITTGILKELAGIPGVVQGSNELAKLVGDEKAVELATRSLAAGQEAYNKVILDASKGLDEARKKKEENRKATDDLTESLKRGTSAQEDEADAQLAAARAADELAEAADEAAAAQAKINEAMAKAALDLQRNLEDIDIETARKRLDILEDFADKRIDAARKNAEKIADIERKNEQDIQDAKTDKARSDRDAQIKLARAQLDQAKDEAQKQIDIEVDYRRKLADIRTQFELDAQEAEERRDAVAFIRALKKQNEEIQQAETERQQAIEDARSEGEARRAELQQQFQFELIDNTIAYNRKREDLNTALARQLEDQRIAYAREQEELAINEERKLEELATNRQRDIEDAQRAYDRKLEDLQASLEAEYALIQEYNALLEAEALRHAEAMAAANALASEAGASAGGITPGITGGGSRGPGGSNIPNKPLRDIPGFAEGGVVPGPMGQPRLVVAHGGETITPPGQPVLMPTFGGGMGGSVTNSRQTNVNLPLATPEQILSPFLMAQIRNMMVRTLGDVN